MKEKIIGNDGLLNLAKKLKLKVIILHRIYHHQVKISRITLAHPLTKKMILAIIDALVTHEKKLMNGSCLVLVDPRAVAGITHLKACIQFALKSFKQKDNIADKLGAEIMLFLSAQRQISKAIKKVGISEKSKELLFIEVYPSDTPHLANASILPFNLEDFLEQEKVECVEITADLDSLPLINEDKVKRNLEIAEKEIAIMVPPQKVPQNRALMIEKIAIEKSALLTINK
ncbi:MAG: hypothetical protein GF308_12870 [Candidatus Heimdallarchaeota archaeon]|nr:hypothetical protein [Candidatus Heimdallarchaeota archaeon]